MRSLVGLAVVLVLGCAPAARHLSWEISFDTPALAARAQIVEGRILNGGCASGTVAYAAEAGRGESPAMPASLAPGRYGFEASARDVDCVTFARGCVEIEVPRPEGDVVEVRLSAVAEAPACSAASCDGGRCMAADGGLDAGRDAGVVDGGAMDGGGLDGGPDAPDARVNDAGVDAPVDGGVPRVVDGYGVGTAFVCATSSGALFCWGSNFAGQLGVDTSGMGTNRTSPTLVGTSRTWSTLGMGDEHVCGTVGADLFCWGDNMDGQLATGDMTSRTTPTRAGTVTGPFAIIDGATVGDHTCTLRPDGVLSCVGQNDYGQLGLADNVDHLAYGAWMGGYDDVSVGHHFTCAIRDDGALFCTGRNAAGQLGTGVVGDVNAPVQVGTGLDWVDVDAGDSHVCAVRGTGQLWCWGAGADGRLGDGGTTNRNAPVMLTGAADWSMVSGGLGHTCGIRGSGQLWCWGANADGQAGRDTGGVDVLTPQRVGTASDWTSVRAGGTFTCGTRGTDLYCWGSNGSGELGLGDTTSRSTPTLVRIF